MLHSPTLVYLFGLMPGTDLGMQLGTRLFPKGFIFNSPQASSEHISCHMRPELREIWPVCF